jgi:hypothetical protein
MANLEKCENCSRSIGNLETAHVFESHIVCEECLSRLSSRNRSRDESTDWMDNLASKSSGRCPRCGAVGIISQRGVVGGEIIKCLLLLWIFVIPGFIYYAMVDGKPYCPSCRNRV